MSCQQQAAAGRLPNQSEKQVSVVGRVTGTLLLESIDGVQSFLWQGMFLLVECIPNGLKV